MTSAPRIKIKIATALGSALFLLLGIVSQVLPHGWPSRAVRVRFGRVASGGPVPSSSFTSRLPAPLP